MADVLAVAEIRLWGQRVGAVAELDDRTIVFEYDEPFSRMGLEISPIRLPRATRGPIDFPTLGRKPSFQGLPGVLSDALPDAFGNEVIRAYFAARGEEERAFSQVQRLLYVGDHALGALTFRPAAELPIGPAESEALQVSALVADARRVIHGDPEVAVPEIYRIGASAGGKRPKALVLFDPVEGVIRSGFALPGPNDRPCILKFDGVGPDADPGSFGQPLAYNRVEAAYARLADLAGIDVARVSILPGAEPFAHLLIERFDLDVDTRLHQHTLGGMLHVDYNDVGASSYEEYLRTILRLGMPPAAVEEGYRRMLFNILAINQDDHVKNLSFHMAPDGRWSLTPAYDLTFARGQGWTATHQMRVADKLSGITLKDVLDVGRSFGVKRPERIVEGVRSAIGGWPDAAREVGVGADDITRVQDALDGRWRGLGGSEPEPGGSWASIQIVSSGF